MRNIAVNEKRLFNVFKNMVDIYSPSGKEHEIIKYISDFFAENNLKTKTQKVDDSRYNILVSKKYSEDIGTLFLGHIDTVPAFDIERYGFSFKNNICHGLGSADMKGGCAALIEAFLCAKDSGCLSDNIMLALVVGEEETGDGTKFLLEKFRFKNAIVAEPTDLKPCFDHYGYVEMIVRAFGYRRHAAMSNRETNAIRALLRFLLKLEEMVEEDNLSAVINIRDLHSSESGFAVPDRCVASIDFHIPPDVDAKMYACDIKKFAKKELTESGASRYEIDFATLANGYRTDSKNQLLLDLKSIYKSKNLDWIPQAFKSHSDANLLKDANVSPVILGPGLLSKAHTVDESVDFKQVVNAAKIYLELIKKD